MRPLSTNLLGTVSVPQHIHVDRLVLAAPWPLRLNFPPPSLPAVFHGQSCQRHWKGDKLATQAPLKAPSHLQVNYHPARTAFAPPGHSLSPLRHSSQLVASSRRGQASRIRPARRSARVLPPRADHLPNAGSHGLSPPCHALPRGFTGCPRGVEISSTPGTCPLASILSVSLFGVWCEAYHIRSQP